MCVCVCMYMSQHKLLYATNRHIWAHCRQAVLVIWGCFSKGNSPYDPVVYSKMAAFRRWRRVFGFTPQPS